MASSRVSDGNSIKSCGQMDGIVLSIELDHIPLKERGKYLHLHRGHTKSGDPNSGIVENERSKELISPLAAVKWDNEYCDSQGFSCLPSGCPTQEVVVQELIKKLDPKSQDLEEVSSEAKCGIQPLDSGVNQNLESGSSQNGAAISVGGDCHKTQAYLCPSLQLVKCPTLKIDAGGSEIAGVNINSLPECPTLCDVPGSVKIEESEVLLNSIENGRKSSQSDSPTVEVKKEIPDGVADDLDHIVLKERRRMLLARKMPALSCSAVEGGSAGLMEDILERATERVKEETHPFDGKVITTSNQCNDIPGGNTSLFESSSGITAESSLYCTSHKSAKSIVSVNPQGDHIFESEGKVMHSNLYEEQSGIPVKNDGQINSTFPTSVKVKDEPLDNGNFHNVQANGVGNFSFNIKNVKSEWEAQNKNYDDQVEDMCLRDRLKIFMAGEGFNLNSSRNYPYSKKTRPSSFGRSSVLSESPEPISIKCPRKRKKTATDSVQIALEEDAPGLLQVLIVKGVSVDEIKLYGEMESDEALDESFCEDSFGKLEAVISKIFSPRHSLFKSPHIRIAKASRASYCLACLFSLVEQTRYLQFRKWPVEWGWCRDLQSFIFVFERHNRIVLERPEYGFATYFFELVESLPISWQIKRLVTTMKLTSCSRISLIENKALTVGEDLTEGEAQVLMEYGWTPNSGLGTMLNYCDRVVHDRKNEDSSSEWRSKIAKLLVDGINGGTKVAPNIPKSVSEYTGE